MSKRIMEQLGKIYEKIDPVDWTEFDKEVRESILGTAKDDNPNDSLLLNIRKLLIFQEKFKNDELL